MQKSVKVFFYIFLGFFALYFALFLIVYKTNLNKQLFQSEDFVSTATLPFSIIKEQNFDLNEYYWMLTDTFPHPDDPALTPYYLKQVGEKYYSFFPTATSLLITPLYILPTLSGYDQSMEAIGILSHMGGAYLTALSVAVMWFVIKKFVPSNKRAILLLLTYALATNSLSTSSQGVWQHASSQFLNASGLFFLVSNLFGPAGFFFGLSTIARPTNLLSLVIFGVFVIVTTRDYKKVAYYTAGAMLPLLYELAVDTQLFGSIFNTGYGNHSRWTANIIEGFLGMWVSPSKGLLITTPVLIFMFYGFYRVIRNYKENALFTTLTIAIILHILILGKWYNWFGGYSWGNRMSSDVLPYMVLMLVPFINSIWFNIKVYRWAFLIAFGLSVTYHLAGLVFFDGIWHTIYDGKSKYWLWDIQNSEIVFSIKRALNKVGFISDPIPQNLKAQ